MIYDKNIKSTNPLTCKCGSSSLKVEIIRDGEWVYIECKKCGNMLYYNGA